MLVIMFTIIVTVSASPLHLRTRRQDAPQNLPRLRAGAIFELVEANVGEDVLLPCEIENRGDNFLHWYKNGAHITYDENKASRNAYKLGNQRYLVMRNGLKLKNVKEEAEGLYKCVLSLQGSANLTKTVSLQVYGIPDHVLTKTGPLEWSGNDRESSHSVTGNSGESLSLRCTVKGEGNISIRWFENGVEFGGEGESQLNRQFRFRTVDSIENSKLNIQALNDEDDGKTFRCEATQVMGNGTINQLNRTFHLTVEEGSSYPPAIINEDPNIVAYIGENITHECKILKLEKLNRIVHVGWAVYYGVNTTADNSFVINHGPFSAGAELKIYNVSMEDAGEYICYVTDQMMQDWKIFNLTVLPYPSDVTEPSHQISATLHSNDNSALIVIVGVFAGIAAVVIIILTTVCIIRQRKPEKQPKKRIVLLSPNENYHDYMKDSSSDLSEPLMPPMVTIQGGRNRLSSEICSYSDYEFPLDEQWEITPRNRVQMQHLLGEGAFGCVYYAELLPEAVDDNSISTPIAVKMLKADATDKELVDLVQELEVMKRFSKHRNIINLIGCMTRDGPLYVIVEYAKYGNLRDFLRARRPISAYGSRMLGIHQCDDIQLTTRDLVSFALQIACGMEYLANNQCLHRDLAARNVLVTEEYEMKIADFGLSRNIAQSDYYKKVTEGKLPIKWMSPEALIDRKYTTKSDVWAYGVLLWEIFSLGASPYPTVPHERLFEALREGHRMDRPPHSSQDMYAVMRQCWQYHSAQRPSFTEITQELDRILSCVVKDEYLDLDVSPITSPRASTTTPCTSTTSCSGDEHVPTQLAPPPPSLPAATFV